MILDLLISQRSVSAFAEEKCVCRGKERLPRKRAFAEKGRCLCQGESDGFAIEKIRRVRLPRKSAFAEERSVCRGTVRLPRRV